LDPPDPPCEQAAVRFVSLDKAGQRISTHALTLLVLDQGLNELNRIGRRNLEGDGHYGERLEKDLLATATRTAIRPSDLRSQPGSNLRSQAGKILISGRLEVTSPELRQETTSELRQDAPSHSLLTTRAQRKAPSGKTIPEGRALLPLPALPGRGERLHFAASA